MLQNNGNYSSKITRRRFREFLHDNLDLSEEIIMDRIFKYFNTETQDDIDLEEWIIGFNVILKGWQDITYMSLYVCQYVEQNNMKTTSRNTPGADPVLLHRSECCRTELLSN